MKKLIITCLLMVPTILLGQQWSQTFGGEYNDYGYSVQQTTDGGYIITGGIRVDSLNSDVYLMKTNENGEEEWTQTFGDEYNDISLSVQQTTDGGYIITGNLRVGGIITNLIKTNENGEEEWTQSLGDLYFMGWSVEQTTDGGYILTGFSSDLSGGSLCLIKTTENGEEEWTQTFGGEFYDSGSSVQQTTDGGYIISGHIGVDSLNSDVYLIKTTENGEEEWTQTFGGEFNDFGSSVQQTTDGGYIITGGIRVDSLNSDVCLIKTTENGEEEWTQTFGGEYNDYGYSVQQTTDGGYIITGGIRVDSLNSDVYLMKTNENGEEELSQSFGGEYNDFGWSVEQTTDGGYIITGGIGVDSLNSDIYLLKTIHTPMTSEIELIGCDSLEDLFNNSVIYQSGTFIDTLISQYGGDSIIIQNITINQSPESVLIDGSNIVTTLTIETYQTMITTENELEWTIIGGLLFQDFGNTIEVLWGNEGDGIVELTETNGFGCSTTNILEINISDESTSIDELTNSRRLIKTINVLGNEITPIPNTILIQFYDDGSVEKKLIFE